MTLSCVCHMTLSCVCHMTVPSLSLGPDSPQNCLVKPKHVNSIKTTYTACYLNRWGDMVMTPLEGIYQSMKYRRKFSPGPRMRCLRLSCDLSSCRLCVLRRMLLWEERASMSAASHPRYVQLCMENVRIYHLKLSRVQALLNNSHLYHLAKDDFAKSQGCTVVYCVLL